MGIGQIVTLRLPPHLLNVVNVEIERCAWGAFSTEFFPTYDFVPVRERLAREWREAKAKTLRATSNRAAVAEANERALGNWTMGEGE